MSVIAMGSKAAGRRSQLADVVRSEACKLRSVRSTMWAVIAVFASNVILAAVTAIVLPGHLSAHEKATIDSIRVSLAGMHLSQIAIGVLGVLVISSEYTSGMIRATFSAVPRRRIVLAAKAGVFAATALIAGTAASLAAYFVFQAFLPGQALSSSIGDPGVLRAVLGGGLYLTVLGLLGLGLGAVLRSSAGAIATLFGVLFIPTIIAGILPQTWQNKIAGYLPMNAGAAIYSLHRETGSLAPWAGFAVFCGYGALALGLGFLLITRRDA